MSETQAGSEIVTLANEKELIAKNLVSEGDATRIAQDFAKAKFGWDTPVIASTDVEVDGLAGESSIYVINFQGGGFVLVSAEKRQSPILAYSDTNVFDIEGVRIKQAPEGVRSFLVHLQSQTHDIRVGATAPISSAQAFDRFAEQLHASDDPTSNFVVSEPGGNCTGSYAHTYELNFPAQWDQGCGWNAGDPFANGGPCGHAWAGCVAVAVGQIMKYYAYPASFNWGAMSNTSATLDAALLLRNVGDRLDMDWGADASSTDTENAVGTFKSYGYAASVRYTDVFWSLVPDEAKAGRPFIMRGTRDCDFLGIPTCGGHAWVVTGVYDSYDCGTGRSGRHYKMNWGWSGAFNGWYIDGQVTPGGSDYNFHQAVVIGIHP